MGTATKTETLPDLKSGSTKCPIKTMKLVNLDKTDLSYEQNQAI